MIFEINTRVWLKEQPWAYTESGGSPDIANIPLIQLEEWASLGFTWIWLMGVWEPSPESRAIGLASHDLMEVFKRVFPEATEADFIGSPYAIRDYRLNPALGVVRELEHGEPGSLVRLRERMHKHGLRLMLDFVPNHTAIDHPWTLVHPEYYVTGSQEDLNHHTASFFRTKNGDILAHGRDPYFPAWTDTAQLDYRNPQLHAAMRNVLLEIAAQCDGVRCDMAMLEVNSVLRKTWRDPHNDVWNNNPEEFWPVAITHVHRFHPDFLFMAEVYWEMEIELQAMGFDLTYDKGFYDQLIAGNAPRVMEHLRWAEGDQKRMVRFIENHDEPRAASSLAERHRAAAALVLAVPGTALIHDGQMEGYTYRMPVQFGKRPADIPDRGLLDFYRVLLKAFSKEPWISGRFELLCVENENHEQVSEHLIAIYRFNSESHGMLITNISRQTASGRVIIPERIKGAILGGHRIIRINTWDHESRGVLSREVIENGLYVSLDPGQAEIYISEV